MKPLVISFSVWTLLFSSHARADSTVVFNEIMYHPKTANEAQFEWIELHSQMAVDMDLSGWSLAGGVQFTFPKGTVLGGGGYLVIASSPATLAATTGLTNVLGPFNGRLANAGDKLELRNNNQRVMDSVSYGVDDDWPAAANGAGGSLAKREPDAGSAAPQNWAASAGPGGTPGAANFAPTPGAAPLVFNELASATNADFWIELVNRGPTNFALEGCTLARLGGAHREFAFSGASLAPSQFLCLSKATLGFSADPGDRLVLYGPGQSNVLDAVVARETPRAPDGAGRWLVPTQITPGAANLVRLHDEIVINEIMHAPRTLPATPPVYGPTLVLVSITNSWFYNQRGIDPGAAWRETNYVDDSWPAGRALLYVSTDSLPAPKNTALSLTNSAGTRLVTWYFRTPFVFTGDPAGAELSLRGIIDDGAVFYLNGREINRQNLRPGPVSYTNLAIVNIATAGFTGPFAVSNDWLVAGTNWLAAEVHQFNPFGADVVFGAELTATTLISPAQPERAPPQAWVELFNRASQAVSLAGWRITDGIEFAFADNQVIPPGGYLVIAQDPAYLESLYPGLGALGPYGKSLSRKSDRLVLRDVLGNPAADVHYYSGGLWPRATHGGGSSLELRDPRADHARAEAWSASDESGKSSWATYTYRGIAAAETAASPTVWHEFVLGLLNAGEVLLDNVSVIESPSGAATPLLQNGGFETGLRAWRILGNHKGIVIPDPENPANHVLRLVATGPTEHVHNHAETTLAGGASIINGREYEISFRAKWISGTDALLTRLYFNRLPRVTRIAVPELNGTPGAVNSRYATNIGPTYTGLGHTPAVPAAGQPVPVVVRAADPDGVTNVTLRWSANGGAWNQTTMVARTEGGYLASVPGQAGGALVQFYVEGADALGARSAYPGAGTNSRALFRVNDGQAVAGPLHNVRILMTAADTAALHAPTNVLSNDGLGATVIYNERQVFYDVGLHLRGSERGRVQSERVGYTIHFHPDELFRGVQDSISIDRQGWFTAGVGGNQDEILYKHMINHAGGLPGMYDDLVRVLAPRATENGKALMLMAGYGDEFLDTQYANGDDGDLFKLELVYYPITTADGTTQGLKVPYPSPDGVLGTDIQDLGDDQESYRWIFLKENNPSHDRWDQVMAVAKLFSLTGESIDAPSWQLLDVNEWCRAFAMESLLGNGDTYGFGLPHNFMLYFRPEDGKALALLWDMDVSFNRPTSSALLPSANVTRLFARPGNQRLFYSHLYDLITTTYNADYMGRWTAHYAGLLGENWSGAVNYISARAHFVLGQLPTATAFAITSNKGNDFSTTNNLLSLAGTAPIQTEFIEVNGMRRPITWTSISNWSLSLPLAPGANRLALQAFTRDNASLSNAADTITVTNHSPVPPLLPVVINEFMADNAGPGGLADPADGLFQDWFELFNPNTNALDLSGYFLTDTLSQPTKWQIPPHTAIAGGGYLLVWADNQPEQNGADGDLHAGFQLSAGGEGIGLSAPDGTSQHQVAFGPQFQNVSQGLFPDGYTTGWQLMTNWTPRTPNQLGPPPAPQLARLARRPDGALALEFSAIPNRTYRLESKDDLAVPSWTPLVVNHTAAGAVITVADVPGYTGAKQRFYRVVLLP